MPPALNGQTMFQNIDMTLNQLQTVGNAVELTAEVLKSMNDEQQAFQIYVTDLHALEEQQKSASSTEAFAIEQQIQNKRTVIQQNLEKMKQLNYKFLEAIQQNIRDIDSLKLSIFQDKLCVWKLEQQHVCNGARPRPNVVSLDMLQFYLEKLADFIWRTKQQLHDVERLQSVNVVFETTNPSIGALLEDVKRLLASLLNEAFIVEEQPPQVLKKSTKIMPAVKVSLLLGNLTIQLSSPEVTATIIREAHARNVSVAEKIVKGGDLVNSKANLEFDSHSKRITAKFSSMKLDNINRGNNRRDSNSGNERVMEEKFSLLFESSVIICDLKIRIRTMSLPVVVTSHGSQESTATATIMWDNAFGVIGRTPFHVPTTVPWTELAQVISDRFRLVTGRGLDENQLRCLQHKVFRNRNHSENISWQEFCKDNLPDRQFSFWEWIFAALKVIEKKETHLKEIWKRGYLAGFIEKSRAESQLHSAEPGTFLLRFSDTFLGAISIVVINDVRQVYSVNPYSSKDLETIKLADNLKNLNELRYLYSNPPMLTKDQAFRDFYTPPSQNKLDYVPFRTSIEGVSPMSSPPIVNSTTPPIGQFSSMLSPITRSISEHSPARIQEEITDEDMDDIYRTIQAASNSTGNQDTPSNTGEMYPDLNALGVEQLASNNSMNANLSPMRYNIASPPQMDSAMANEYSEFITIDTTDPTVHSTLWGNGEPQQIMNL